MCSSMFCPPGCAVVLKAGCLLFSAVIKKGQMETHSLNILADCQGQSAAEVFTSVVDILTNTSVFSFRFLTQRSVEVTVVTFSVNEMEIIAHFQRVVEPPHFHNKMKNVGYGYWPVQPAL